MSLIKLFHDGEYECISAHIKMEPSGCKCICIGENITVLDGSVHNCGIRIPNMFMIKKSAIFGLNMRSYLLSMNLS